MAKVIPIGEPVNDSEKLAIAHLRDVLPDNYLLLHNFEIHRGYHIYEVDLALLTPHALYLIDVKGTRGLIDVYGSKWYPDGRMPFTSPLAKLRGHARSLKGMITDSDPARRELREIFVDGIVLLTAQDANLQDPGGRDAPSVTTLTKAASFFQNAGRVPGRFSKNIGRLHNLALKALDAKVRPYSGPLRFKNWEVVERLGSTSSYTDYRAFNSFDGRRNNTVLLRTYDADAYLTTDKEKKAQLSRIANAYRALSMMPGHPGIMGVRDFFATEAQDQYILVTEDVAGQALRVHIDKPARALTLDQKLRVAGDLLSALAHAHSHNVVHRNLTPSTVIVGLDGRVRIVGFDYARAGTNRSSSIAKQIIEELEPLYMAPELQGEATAASPASDIFSAGLVLYELFAGEQPFGSPTEVWDQKAVFPTMPSALRSEVPAFIDGWLQSMCTDAERPQDRPSAEKALAELRRLMSAEEDNGVDKDDGGEAAGLPTGQPDVRSVPKEEIDYRRLPAQTRIGRKFIVEKRLGKPGSFGVVYKVVDTLGDIARAIKLILHDRTSTIERLKQEYKTLVHLPEHPHVVKVVDASLGEGAEPPYIVFEYVDGLDVGEMIDDQAFSPEDTLCLAQEVADGLGHLHKHGVFHCDIKPRNLLWTDSGARIIDFNVSVLGTDGGHGGGSRRFLPPDLDLLKVPQSSDLVDRDLYALGITLYLALTGEYPWREAATPPAGQPPLDPRERTDLSGIGDLAPGLIEGILKAIAPKRSQRFATAADMERAFAAVAGARRIQDESSTSGSLIALQLSDGASSKSPPSPNTNPFVSALLTLYSQSQHSNAGTRGLDAMGKQTYVNTLLDSELLPAALAGEFRLVVITGNAGDGKTAFLQKLEEAAADDQAVFESPLTNGRRFSLRGKTFTTNYDGSQDEGDESNSEVLRAFFEPFGGENVEAWPTDQVRLIAINEGRLVDFLASEGKHFAGLRTLVERGLRNGTAEHGVAVVNLNLRSVVAEPAGLDGSIMERLIRRMTHEKFWKPCQGCDLQEKCYAIHNARTFQSTTAGPKVIERLKTIYTLSHLRGQLHITLRDLRSALAFMLVGTRNCEQIHELYQSGNRQEVAESFYFNAWMSAGRPSSDRLIRLLAYMDVGVTPDPRLDRSLDFVSPTFDRSLFKVEHRGTYDREVLRRLFDDLPRDFSGRANNYRMEKHRAYLAMARRRAFFERRDAAWGAMLPYRAAGRMLAAIRSNPLVPEELQRILQAINRGEGLTDPERLGGNLALQVRRVERGTIRSYRVFDRALFTLSVMHDGDGAQFVEHMPSGLILSYSGLGSAVAELRINLDIFEMLERFNVGYRASVEEEQGYNLSLVVFKNMLGSEPYQDVLLTRTGHDFYRVHREEDGRLQMQRLDAVSPSQEGV